jgi:hypothetical protein
MPRVPNGAREPVLFCRLAQHVSASAQSVESIGHGGAGHAEVMPGGRTARDVIQHRQHVHAVRGVHFVSSSLSAHRFTPAGSMYQ